jgi:hypothetical protein
MDSYRTTRGFLNRMANYAPLVPRLPIEGCAKARMIARPNGPVSYLVAAKNAASFCMRMTLATT